MSSRARTVLLGALLASAAAAAFLAIALDRTIYAPGAHALQQHIASTDGFGNPVLSGSRFGHLVFLFVRKSYSIVAFAIVGALAAPVFARGRRVAACILVVVAFSTLIEIAQYIAYDNESNLSRAFDIGCGALGGAIGAIVWNAATRSRGRRA